MSGYPIAWDDQPGRADSCPYGPEEIEQYLDSCHYHWTTHELPTHHELGKMVIEQKGGERSYWVFEATDAQQRPWLVIVGSGASPFDKRTTMRRWMHAESNEVGEDPQAWFARALEDQALADLRK
jgi:hypothetical protein